MASQSIGGRRRPHDRIETEGDLPKPQPPKRSSSRAVNWWHEKPSNLPLVRSSQTTFPERESTTLVDPEHSQSKPWRQDTVEAANGANEQKEKNENPKAGSEFSEEDCHKMSLLDNYTQLQAFQVPAPSHHFHKDITEHFSMDVVDDIESQLEEVSRLKRWGHFDDALEHFSANLGDHLDLPLVAIGYANLLLEQGSYKELVELISSQRLWPPQKTKCIHIGNDEVGRDLYGRHFSLLELRARLSFESISSEILDRFQRILDSFVQYLKERAYSRHVGYPSTARGMPFDSTEVQIICEQFNILCFIQSERKIAIPHLISDVWQDLYNDLLMDERIWELCDLLIAMFRLLGPFETFEHLFKVKAEHSFDQVIDRNISIRESLARLLQDWSVDEYDESTELALLSMLVELLYSLNFGSLSRSEFRNYSTINSQWFEQQANVCAEKIRQHSPHLTRSRPYLQWALAKEHLDRSRNRGSLYLNASGLVLITSFFPVYIPMASENTGWPSADPKFPPNDSLDWILKTSTELGDYKTKLTCLRELICRVEDPRPLLKELDQLLQAVQGDHIEASECIVSQYMLASDDKSRRELLRKLKDVAAKFRPTPDDDSCVATRWNNLMVQNALCRSLSEEISIIDQNVKIAQSICQKLPYSQRTIDRFSEPAPVTNDKIYGEPPEKYTQNKPTEEMEARNPKQTPPKGDLNAPGKFDRRYEEDHNRRLRQLGFVELQQEIERLEEELHNRKVRRRHKEYEDELRVVAGKENIRSRLREERLNLDTKDTKDTKPSDEVAHDMKKKKQIEWKQMSEGDIEEYEETQTGENGMPMALEPEEIEYEPGKRDQKSPEHSQKPYRYASVTEPEEESLLIRERDSNSVSPVRRARSVESVASSAHDFDTAVEVSDASSGTSPDPLRRIVYSEAG